MTTAAKTEDPGLVALAHQAVRECKDVAKVYRFHRVYEPFRAGDPTEVVFEGRRSGSKQVRLLSAWLTDDPPGFSKDVLVTDA